MKNGRCTRLNCLLWIITSLYYFLFFRFNVHVSSGITSAVLRFKEGPIAMAKGFGLGYSLLYAMDKVSCSLCGNTVPIRCAMFHGTWHKVKYSYIFLQMSKWCYFYDVIITVCYTTSGASNCVRTRASITNFRKKSFSFENTTASLSTK